jgi:hypothetical protein
MENPELFGGARLKGLDAFRMQLFHADDQARLIFALADWSVLLLLALIAYLSVVLIAPLMDWQPTDELRSQVLLKSMVYFCRPEPQEQASYLLICSIVPLSMVVWLLSRSSLIACLKSFIKESILIKMLWTTGITAQLALFGFIMWNVSGSERVVARCFVTGAISVTLIGLFLWKTRSFYLARSSSRSRVARPDFLLPELIAIGYTVIRLLPSIAIEPNHYQPYPKAHLGSTLGAFAAALNGRTNLVDYASSYNFLLNYLLEPIFRLFGLTPATYTMAMSVLTLIVMMMVFAIFKALTKSSWLSLGCFLPFCAISFFPMDQSEVSVYTFANYFAAMPLRYFGPVLAAFLTSWYLQRPSKGKMSVLFLTGGLSLVQNPDFGLSALVASLIAVLSSTAESIHPRGKTGFLFNLVPAKGKTASILSIFVGSVGLAIFLWVSFTFVRSGKFPDIGMLLLIRRLFVYFGFNMIPMDLWGIHWLLLLTYFSALFLVMVRHANRANFPVVSRGQADRLTGKVTRLQEGMLLFAGIFGMGSGFYFVARSHIQVLIILFFAWGLTFTLLCLNLFWTGDRFRINQKPLILMAMPISVLLTTFCVFVGTIKFVPSPLSEMTRLSYAPTEYNQSMAKAVQFVKSNCPAGSKVGIVHILGYSIANLAGVKNVFPYDSPDMVLANQQVDTFVSALRAQNVEHVFLQKGTPGVASDNSAEFEQALENAGYHCAQVLPEPIGAYPIFTPIEHWIKRPEHAEE